MLILQRSGALLARALLALLVCLIAGLLVAGVALPVVGGTGLMARKGIQAFDDSKDLDTVLDQLVNLNLGQRSRIVDVGGQLLAEVQTAEDRTLAKIEQVPDVMVHALVAIEDSRFYQHHGVDLKGVARAALKNQQSGQVQQGASTLTQQYVKNALLTIAQTPEERKAAIEQTPGRKLREVRLALEMERRFSKNEILERYLNIAYFGNGAYGVRTAAQFYFKLPIERVTLVQAALLAGLVQSPTRWDPVRHPEAAKRRRNVVLAKMAELFPCTSSGGSAPPVPQSSSAPADAAPVCYTDQAAAAAQQDLGLNIRKQPGNVTSVAPYFLDYVQDYLLEDSTVLGKTKEEREAAYFRGGITIRTTLDRKVQAAAQAALESTDFKDTEPSTAIVVIEPGTGAIRAMAVNTTPKGNRSLNLATGGQFGMQAGSTFKMFVLAAALQQGMPLGTSFDSPAQYTSTVFEKSHGVPYKISNAADSESGVFNLLTGTWDSVNTFYLQLEEKTQIKPAVDIARKMMGPHPARPIGKAVDTQPSFVLGTTQTSVLDVANAYATIAARGIACQATGVAEITNARREKLNLPTPNCARAIPEKVADTLAFVLQGVIDGDHTRTGFRATIGRPAAGKTGTAQEYRSAFFAGFTPDYAAAVWMGNSLAPGSEEGKLLNVPAVDGAPVEKVFGGTFPAVIWAKTMTAIEAGKPVKTFVDPPPDVFVGTEIDVPDLGGKTIAEAQTILAALNISPVFAPLQVNSLFPAGTVASTNPPKGGKIAIGSSVTVYVSNGKPPAPPPCATVSASGSVPPPSPTPSGTPTVPCTIPPPPACVATPTAPCPTVPAGSSAPGSSAPPPTVTAPPSSAPPKSSLAPPPPPAAPNASAGAGGAASASGKP
ncbi:MAG: transglycosylase domain-containing protein [Actinomycetota bacterium]